MKPITVMAGLGLLAAALTTTVEAIERVPGDAMLAMHFHPETAEASRRATLAATAWLEDSDADPAQWRQRMEALMLVLERRAEIVPPHWAPAADGLFAWLAYSGDKKLRSTPVFAAMPGLERLGERLQGNARAGSLARAHWAAAMGAPDVWERLANRLEAADGLDAQGELTAFWRLLAASVADDRHDAHARRQAERVLELAQADSADRRGRLRVELVLEEARLSAAEDRILSSVWQSMEALVRLTGLQSPQAPARALAGHLEALAERPTAELRAIDTQLPRVIALLQDAVAHLAADDPSTASALRELADAYARLALFVTEASFYLDQPVRDDIRAVIADCSPDPLQVGLLPRDSFEACLQRLIAHMADDLAREELVGDGSGPFSRAFLQREAELVSWQRANYLDGHLDWLLESGCEPPAWENLLEWSLLTRYLADWVPQRPVYFAARRWQNAVESLRNQALEGIAGREQWRDCLSGRGGERLDIVQRLMTRHQRLLDDLAVALESAAEEHYASVTRPGADVDLDGPADQRTSFRPEGLEVVPCDGGQTCGAEVTLPVSRALLGRFPNAFLLADQLRMGKIGLCYDQVRWVDRTLRSARAGDDRVANYHGRLSFELVGQFHIGADTGTVFRQRLIADESRHYLFAEADEAIARQDCPDSVVGDSIVSELPRSRFGLVPNRLTYFASKPISPDSVMTANWVEGEEWRDWFVTGSRVESIEATDGGRLAVAVEARLDELSVRRERQLASRLLSPTAEAEDETDALSSAMAELDSNSALLRRLLELHYPRVIRHDDALRGLVVGESGLLTRERVRRMRDEGEAMTGIAETGRVRLASFLDHWVRLPVELREGGQVAPELDVSLEQLDRLLRLSRAWPMAGGDGESPAGQ